ncbi:MAG: translation initiation factor IF-2 subunit gamma [Desulfurococcales archaeon]|jgi:translation initiation factor 2 subunit 3|nr:translation initiation factor IF-2 subunit gamma [Desulfurococcaceae archaeon]MDT7865868.1 translation initiation factor IF-2 subunit gamma [Desulfurococcales archaeon]
MRAEVLKVEKYPEVNIGVVGHVDHGKTTLVQALTGIWTMRHSEEIRKAMTIKLGYADGEVWVCRGCGYPEMYTPEPVCECKPGAKPELVRRLSFVDAPGHETLMTVMLSGAAVMDGAILVIAANEPCPQPQTREHLVALEILGIKNIIVAQNKVDVVTPERARESYEEIERFLEGTIAEGAPVIPVSALKRVNVDALLAAIEEYIPTPERDLDKPPLMYVLRSFDVNKPGTLPEKLVGGVLGGSVIQGRFRVGDEIEIRPGLQVRRRDGSIGYEPVVTRIEGLRYGSLEVDEARPGGLVAIATTLDPSITKADNMVGNIAGKPGQLPPEYTSLTIEYSLFETLVGTRGEVRVEPLKPREQLLLSIGPSTVPALVKGVRRGVLDVDLARPVVSWRGAKVAISRKVVGRWRLIGWGVVRV